MAKPKTRKWPKATWTLAFPEQVKKGQRERRDTRDNRYKASAAAFRKANPKCAACPIVGPVDGRTDKGIRKTRSVHHWARRNKVHVGTQVIDLLLYKPYWVPTCAACHDYIHDNKDWARSKGLLAPVGEWNEVPNALQKP